MGFRVPNTSQKQGLRRNLHDADSVSERLVKITDSDLTFRMRKCQQHDTRLRAKIRPIVERRDSEDNEIVEVWSSACKVPVMFHVYVCIEMTRVFRGLGSGLFPSISLHRETNECYIERFVNAHLIFAIISNNVDLPFYSLIFYPDENVCRPSRLTFPFARSLEQNCISDL